MNRIPHIPGYRSTPRTLAQANRQHEANNHLRRVAAAKCQPLHTREEPVHVMRVVYWVAGFCALIALAGIAVALLGWAVIIIGIVAALVIAWAFGTAIITDEEAAVSDERPEYGQESVKQ
jgi:fatty acid desaturase